jgi:pimeloyl-ACP methyl ester carboxylesterase
MHYRLGATALALISGAQLALAQECPPGYAKSSKVGWANCPTPENESLQCATLEVPLDWTKPTGGEKLKLRLVRQPAASGSVNAKSIIINPGGPGESGIKSVVDGGSGYQDVVGDGFHIIGFDPRGVGLTIPYTCLEAAGDVGEYNTDDGFKAAFEYNTAQAKDCANVKYGSDLIGTAFVARDIKAIADALGEDGLIRYWGYSYGTLLGATLSAMFPNQMDRVILDGNINPTDYYRGL